MGPWGLSLFVGVPWGPRVLTWGAARRCAVRGYPWALGGSRRQRVRTSYLAERQQAGGGGGGGGGGVHKVRYDAYVANRHACHDDTELATQVGRGRAANIIYTEDK